MENALIKRVNDNPARVARPLLFESLLSTAHALDTVRIVQPGPGQSLSGKTRVVVESVVTLGFPEPVRAVDRLTPSSEGAGGE